MAFRPSSELRAGTRKYVLQCRGDVRLFRGGIDCTPKPKKGRALLAVLAVEQRPLNRTKIVDLLWSKSPEEQARASLRTLLADLREQFGEDLNELLIVDRERVELGPNIETDLLERRRAGANGEYFEGLDHLDDELDQWLRLERQRLGSGTGTELRARPKPGRHGRPWLLATLVACGLLFAVAGAIVFSP